ncbi:MAG: DNA polymerase III subunit gamma/tau, partial [Oscillospiraceae bacterium]
LKNEIANDNLSHAYLFVGSRGTGKTTCAKLLAKAVNCLNPVNGNPCCKCENCIAAEDGTLIDITEIDAASNNGVENIRALRDEVQFTPNKAKYRVYIIDEVHMLSQSAFNALLKTLEEPPEYVIFILATTEIHKVIPTIISRCQRFDFKRIDEKSICARLSFVSQKEGIELDENAAQLIARLSDGALRDALSLLDVCSANDKHVTEETVSNASGITGSSHLIKLCDFIIKKSVSDVFICLEELFNDGLNPLRLCRDLILHYRNLMLIKTVKEPWDMVICLNFEQELLKEQSKQISLDEILYVIDVLQDCCSQMSRGIDNKTALESNLLILSDVDRAGDTKSLLNRIERLEKIVAQGCISKSRVEIGENIPKKEIYDNFENASESTDTNNNEEITEISDRDRIVIFDRWQSVLSEIKTTNPAIFGMLGDTKAYFNGKYVLIDV